MKCGTVVRNIQYIKIFLLFQKHHSLITENKDLVFSIVILQHVSTSHISGSYGVKMFELLTRILSESENKIWPGINCFLKCSKHTKAMFYCLLKPFRLHSYAKQ